MKAQLFLIVVILSLSACATSDKPYSYYLLDPQTVVPKDMVEKPEQSNLEAARSERTVKSRWNDGDTYTEVDIPVLSSGQRIISRLVPLRLCALAALSSISSISATIKI